ncbi:hypothetical protein AAFG07_33210 [Bradyrhizobium sp. B097]|uniref:hypothetical protein n=1 Tax=Bradyrhizobium sp. B097 TaxID=3140244 RepID=UPI0031830FD1
MSFLAAHLVSILQWLSIGLALVSGALWIWSAKVPLNLTYHSNEPFVLDLKVLQQRADQITNDAAVKATFAEQSRLSAAAGAAAFLSAIFQLLALFP